MNQTIKELVYKKGTQKQVDFMAEIGGMNDEEKQMFNLMHKGYTDQTIMAEMCIEKKTFERIEESVRAKLLIAVFECIHYRMWQE